MMTERTTFNLARLVVIGMAVQLSVIAYVFWVDYQGRVAVTKAAREACERDKRDRATNATGWRIAEDARWAERDYVVSTRYGHLASKLEEHASINCNERHPKASIFP